MKLSLLLIFTFILSSTAISQYCENVGPSNSADSNIETVYLNGDASSINFIGCPAVIGFDDQTNLSATVTAGVNYILQVQFGTCDGNYAGIGEAWIDFNKNDEFELNESIGTWAGTPPTNLSNFSFTPPINTINGPTRLRVIQREGGTHPIDPCGTFTWGSVTDFTINITGGIDCSPFVGDTEQDPVNITSVPYSGTFDNSYCYFNHHSAYPSPDIYFLLDVADSAHSVTISLCGSSFDTFLSVFDKQGNTITFNDDSDNCGSQSEVSFDINGRDSIMIIVEGWGTEQGEFDINVTGHFLGTESFDAREVTIYPNPANNLIRIEGISSQEISIHNAMGKLVQKSDYIENSQISVADLSAGFYIVAFNIEGQLKTKTLIIN